LDLGTQTLDFFPALDQRSTELRLPLRRAPQLLEELVDTVFETLEYR